MDWRQVQMVSHEGSSHLVPNVDARFADASHRWPGSDGRWRQVVPEKEGASRTGSACQHRGQH